MTQLILKKEWIKSKKVFLRKNKNYIKNLIVPAKNDKSKWYRTSNLFFE